MGSLVWQHNDCWPVASWSSRDYYGRWKAQHYFTVKSFADILIAPIEKDGELQVYVVSDRLKKTSGTLIVQVIDIHKGITAQQEIPLTVPENTSTLLWKNKVNELLHGLNKEDAVIHLEYHDKQGKVYENNHFLVSQKEVKYDKVVVFHTITPVAGGYELTLSTDKFVRGVFISLNGKDDFITDNYFDLLPNKSSTVLLKTALPLSVVKENLTIKSFADAY
jgi:beta-mannosidase